MIQFEREHAFILHRRAYGEKKYLIDVFSFNYGQFRAVGNTSHQKKHPHINTYIPFQLLQITGQRKSNLAILWQTEVKSSFMPPPQKVLNAHYLNELLLGLLPYDEPAPQIFNQYLLTLQKLDVLTLRQFEYRLLLYLDLIPEIKTNNAPYYHLDTNSEPAVFRPAEQGYDKEIILSLQQGTPNWFHPETRLIFQEIIRFNSKHNSSNTKKTALAIKFLLK